jgi:hypothetical protein
MTRTHPAEVYDMGIPRRSLTLVGGALVLMTAVGVGLVHASSSPPAVVTPDAVVPAAAPLAATSAATADGTDALAAALRLRGRGLVVHGTVTIDSPKEGLITVQLDGGTISAVDADSVTIAEKGGGSVTVAIDAQTRVRRDRKRATAADLKVGDNVRVVSRVATGGAATAKAIVVAPATRG